MDELIRNSMLPVAVMFGFSVLFQLLTSLYNAGIPEMALSWIVGVVAVAVGWAALYTQRRYGRANAVALTIAAMFGAFLGVVSL